VWLTGRGGATLEHLDGGDPAGPSQKPEIEETRNWYEIACNQVTNPMGQSSKKQIDLDMPADDVGAGKPQEDDDHKREAGAFGDDFEPTSKRIAIDGINDEGNCGDLQDDRRDMNPRSGKFLQRIVPLRLD